jgi:hypothetical protein
VIGKKILRVMPAPGAGIHVFLCAVRKTWMAGTSPAMTRWRPTKVCRRLRQQAVHLRPPRQARYDARLRFLVRSPSLLQHRIPNLFHRFEALPGFVRDRDDRVAAGLVMRDEAVAHQVHRLHIVDGVGQGLFDAEYEWKRPDRAHSFPCTRALGRCPSPARHGIAPI